MPPGNGSTKSRRGWFLTAVLVGGPLLGAFCWLRAPRLSDDELITDFGERQTALEEIATEAERQAPFAACLNGPQSEENEKHQTLNAELVATGIVCVESTDAGVRLLVGFNAPHFPLTRGGVVKGFERRRSPPELLVGSLDRLSGEPLLITTDAGPRQLVSGESAHRALGGAWYLFAHAK